MLAVEGQLDGGGEETKSVAAAESEHGYTETASGHGGENFYSNNKKAGTWKRLKKAFKTTSKGTEVCNRRVSRHSSCVHHPQDSDRVHVAVPSTPTSIVYGHANGAVLVVACDAFKKLGNIAASVEATWMLLLCSCNMPMRTQLNPVSAMPTPTPCQQILPDMQQARLMMQHQNLLPQNLAEEGGHGCPCGTSLLGERARTETGRVHSRGCSSQRTKRASRLSLMLSGDFEQYRCVAVVFASNCPLCCWLYPGESIPSFSVCVFVRAHCLIT